MTMTPSLLSDISIGIGAVNSTIGGIAQWKEGSAEKETADLNAAITLENMRQEEEASRSKFAQVMARQRILYAKAGVDLASGSPLLVLAATAMNAEEEKARIEAAGESQSRLQRFYGRAAAFSGKVRGLSTFLTGIGAAADKWYEKHPPSTKTKKT